MNQSLEFILRLILAGTLGAAIGAERKAHFKQAGVRTHFVVAIGSALIMIVSKYAFMDVVNGRTIVLDPSRMAAQVVSGIGFLGGGLIIFHRNAIRGLTTAAGVWATASIGLAVGAGLYLVGVICTFLVLTGFVALKPLERRFIRNLKHLMISGNDSPGLVGRINTEIEELGLNIEQISIDRTDEANKVLHLDLYILVQKVMDVNQVTQKLADIEGVTRVVFLME